GENIEPAPIERAIKGSDLVESVVVLGQDRKYLAALIVPARDAVLARAADEGLPTDDYAALLENPAILQLFRSEIDARINHHAGFRPFEFIFRIGLLSDSFQVGRELSGKQEMMRHRIGALYASQIAALFEEARA
ncbi:MAG TPA: long-chain fatty acid--CoA ligase, partial [Treponemataceae bacterium]|nr:long-chain fatty acid--CoA ligase [Treponemataceae bacterium]